MPLDANIVSKYGKMAKMSCICHLKFALKVLREGNLRSDRQIRSMKARIQPNLNQPLTGVGLVVSPCLGRRWFPAVRAARLNSQCAGISGDAASATNAPKLRYQNPGQLDVTRRDPSETRSLRNCSPHSDTLGSATVLLNNATRASATDSCS